ncbi:MAG: hypothetical protein J6J13_04475 [Clostridia bacterium]|nr:hypothetical protein [Clostridia bacterium]
MKTFFKVLIGLVTAVAAIVGALMVFDKIVNKNRIKGNYLECDSPEDDFDEDEIA